MDEQNKKQDYENQDAREPKERNQIPSYVDKDVPKSEKEDASLSEKEVEAVNLEKEDSAEEAEDIEEKIPVSEEKISEERKEPQFSCSYEPPYGAPILSSDETLSDQSSKRKKKPKALIAILIVIGIIVTFIGGALLGPIFLDQESSLPMPSGSGNQEGEKKVYANFAEVFAAVADSVVDIDVVLANGKSSGSGVIIDEEGYIITNHHVVENFSEIVVRLRDETEYQAFYIGGDSKYDIAVLKINPLPNSELVVATLGNSAEVKVAEEVTAIGNPLGLSGTVTHGIISGKRVLRQDFYPMNYLQIDAPINNGNSGGAVFNMSGELIGIVTAKVIDFKNGDQTVSVEGLGFAIPIDVAWRCAKDLIEYGYVTGEPELGISIEMNNSVVSITESHNEEINVNDQIIAIQGNKVTSMEEIYAVTDKMEIGDQITLTLRRRSGLYYFEFDVTITVEEYQP